LSMSHSVHRPHFVCELCTVQMELQQEIQRTDRDIHLLMFERMRMIDAMNWWKKQTLQQYSPHLRYLCQFDHYYGVKALSPTFPLHSYVERRMYNSTRLFSTIST
jgi:hypothetical protein